MTSSAFSLRLSGGDCALGYPGESQQGPAWQPEKSLWLMEIDVPDLQTGALLTPSLSILGNWPYDYDFELISGKNSWPLPRVPSEADSRPPAGSNDWVQGELDCWHIRRDLHDVRLRVRCAAARAPERYLLTLSARAKQLRQLPDPPRQDVQTIKPIQHSQMLENPRIASRICSPVSLAMALSQSVHTTAPLHQVLPLCLDPATGMYGMWPLAIRTASRFDVAGAVELLNDWSLVTASLARGRPVVASIRYAIGTLANSPQPGSNGHLVVVYGIAGNRVLVNDPAAPDRGTVSRHYDIEQFSEAWFRHRGAAYILAS